MSKGRQPQPRRCPICDELYEAGSERAKMHEHPEPQSGEFRDAWLASKLPYERWLVETVGGMQWERIVDWT